MTTASPSRLSRTLHRVAGGRALDGLPDGELLARFVGGRDEAAFATLVRRHGGMVFGTCRRVLGNAADADDAFQAAFVVLVRKAATLTACACVGGFLHGVAYRTALKARAMATKRRSREAQAVSPLPSPTDSSDAEALAALDQELMRLPAKYREPVVLCELEGLARRIAAARLGIAEGTISSRLATAHRMLAKRLHASGFASLGGAGLLAMLSSRSYALSDSQTLSVVRSAVASPRLAVSQLASEVTKMLLLEKVRAISLAALAAALVVAAAIGLTPGSEVAAGDPKTKSPPPDKQPADTPKKAPTEPAWKQEFRAQYGLKDGEHIKRIASPYPKVRADYLGERLGRAPNFAFDDYFTVLGWKDGWAPPALAKHTVPVKPDEGIGLGRLLDMTCGVPQTRIEDPDKLLEVKVTGDFVVRDGSKPDEIAKQLAAILKKECNLEATLKFVEVEREIYVLSGKYEAKPLEGRKKTEIELFGKSLIDRTIGGGGTGTFDELLASVERHVNNQVEAGKIEGMPARLSWHYNVRSPMIKDPANGIDTYAEDTNVHAVLSNLADQTGLTLKVEKRKVQVLKVERAKE